jgi:protease-4
MKPWLIVIVILLVLVVAAVVATASFYWMLSQPAKVAQNSVLEVTVGGTVTETPSDNPLVQLFEPDKPTLLDYWQMLSHASEDRRIKGLSLEIRPLALSWAQLEELRHSLLEFRESGKPIHAFLAVDTVGEAELYLATTANTITVNPDSSLLVNGLLAEVTFYKRTMEKLGIKPQFIQFKEFKSPEVYERETLSAPLREMYESIIKDLENRFVATIAEDRGVTEGAVQTLIDQGISMPAQAAEAGIIDRVGYRQDVTESFKESLGERIRTIEAKDYLRATEGRLSRPSSNRVALVTAAGIITSGNSDAFSGVLGGSTLSEHLRKIRKDDRFKAVLLRVDSPGGSAVGSDMVWNEVRMLEEAGKPVVVSMSGVAGSGGYYISMGASRIICHPSTITGSIGVIFGKFDLAGLLDWLGMSIDSVKVSPNADLFSLYSSLSDSQRERISEWMNEVYDAFVRKAAEGRGSNYAEFESKAHGRIYTGAQALELGLVDSLGGFDASVATLREVLDLEEEATIQLVQYPRPKTFWEAFSSSGLIQTSSSASLQSWLEEEMQSMTAAAPRVLMPEARIY